MIIFLYVLLIIVFLVVIFVAFVQLNNFFALFRARGVPFVPLTKDQLSSIKKFVKIENISFKNIIDMGSGDGRVLRLFEEMGANNLVGYEINFWAHLKAKILNWKNKSKVKVKFKSFDNVDLKNFDIIFCYLLPSSLNKLRDRFENEMKDSAIIISYAFEIEKWNGKREVIITNKENPKKNRIFIYKF